MRDLLGRARSGPAPRRMASPLLALALLVGCDDSALAPAPDAAPPPGCVGFCPADLVCRHGACVGEGAPAWPIALRLRPRADDPLAAVEVRSFDAEGPITELRDLQMPVRTQLVGRAVLAGPAGAAPLRVRATARAQQGIEEQPLSATGELVERADGPRFVMQLAPFWPTVEGERRVAVYRITLRPEDADRYPPWEVDDVRIGLGGSQIDFEQPAGDGLRTVEGSVALSPDNPTPIAGLRVFAVDDGGRRISTETYTDAEGAFELRFWPDGPADVRLRVRRAGDVGPLPDLERALTLPLDAPLRVYFGDLASTFDLSGEIVDDNGDPVAGVAVRLDGAVGEGRYSIDAGPTDVDGHFAATVYPGRYRVDLEPPPDTGSRLVRLETMLDADSAPRWTVPPGTTLRGTLRDPGGLPLAHARIEIRLVSARYADPALMVAGEVPPARIRQTETDRDGQFAIQLDPGEHIARVIPPADSGLPESDHPVTVPVGGGLTPIGLQVPPAAALVFNLLDAEGGPAEDVVVEAWRTDLDPPVRVGETLTGGDGAGTLRLPVVD